MAASRDTDLATADAASPASGLPAKQAPGFRAGRGA